MLGFGPTTVVVYEYSGPWQTVKMLAVNLFGRLAHLDRWSFLDLVIVNLKTIFKL